MTKLSLLALPLFAGALMLLTPSVKAADAAALDTNHDGLVSSTEAEYDSQLKLDFKTRDANGDGRLDSSEIGGLGAPPPPAATIVEENRPGGANNNPGGGGTVVAPGSAASGPGVPSAPGLPSGGGNVSAPAGAAPSAGTRGTGTSGGSR